LLVEGPRLKLHARSEERNAAKRLCKALRERYHDLPIILVEDALYEQPRLPHSNGSSISR
jgi:hypothetical protein